MNKFQGVKKEMHLLLLATKIDAFKLIQHPEFGSHVFNRFSIVILSHKL